jgi:molybdopterin/thiamine biosynthesis adenylyltransferase
VIGAGGLGGHVILLLARLGIGHLVVVDHDVFEESNLNRQALSSMETLGKPKAEAAAATVSSVNPGVKVIPCQVKLDSSNAPEILTGSNVVVDALDNVQDRFLLERTTKKLGIPLVHGALAGFEGQLMTIFPDDPGLKQIYGKKVVKGNNSKGAESVLGVPVIMPSLIGTLQAMEVLKIILNRGRLFRNAMVFVDMETGQLNEYKF